MRKQTKILMGRRRQITKDLSRNSDDWVSTKAVLFSGVVVFPGDSDEAGRRLKAIREKRRRWLLRLFPSEEWRAPLDDKHAHGRSGPVLCQRGPLRHCSHVPSSRGIASQAPSRRLRTKIPQANRTDYSIAEYSRRRRSVISIG